MKQNRIKYKITLWYTGILAAVLLAGVFCVLQIVRNHFRQDAVTELNDEASDFAKELERAAEPLSDISRLNFYDDGVTLAIFDAEGNLVHGLYPDGFPLDTGFSAGNIRTIRKNRDVWMLLDRPVLISGEKYWIRAAYTLSLVEHLLGGLLSGMLLLIPVLLLCAALIGYRMLRRALHPIYAINRMVNDITHSSDLSLRLPDSAAGDELSCLTETFNYMLDHVEGMFQQEVQFTSDAAHELRTPISVILSHCEYCLEELELSQELREELTVIHKRANSMSDLVSQLLMIARAENGSYQPDFEETDLRVLAETVLEELQEKASGRGIQLRCQCRMAQPTVTCDFGLMMRLLINLVENGINYGREYGLVMVELEDMNDEYLIRVRDNGIGIPPESLEKIWNRFYQVDKSRTDSSGFGLGLPMVKWIAGIHKGRVEVKSMPDIGSVFCVYLPYSPDEKNS